MNPVFAEQIKLYMQQAQEMLLVAAHNLHDGFYSSSVNRSYYAVFYAANAILATQQLARKQHSGILSAFRLHFIKPGLIEPAYSDIYGRLFDDRNTSDYQLFSPITHQLAEVDLADAQAFVTRIQTWLQQEGWL